VTENDEEGLTPTGWRVPVLLTVIGVLLGVLVTDLLSSPPQLPWSAIPTLLLLALAETFTAGRTRRRIRGEPGTEPMEPLSAARLLALAKASAIFGALGMGVFVGVALTLLELLALPGPRETFFIALGTAFSAGLLLFSGLYLEHACRVPGDEEDNGDEPPGVT
jgi:hypothetical protein